MALDMHASLVGARSFVDGCCAALSLLLALWHIQTGERSMSVARSSAADETWLKAPHERRRGLLGWPGDRTLFLGRGNGADLAKGLH